MHREPYNYQEDGIPGLGQGEQKILIRLSIAGTCFARVYRENFIKCFENSEQLILSGFIYLGRLLGGGDIWENF
jgi:hypothetical protein